MINSAIRSLRTRRNVARWWYHELKRRCWYRGFYGWMVRRHGKPEYGCGAKSWRVNGTLCSLWLEAARLKIYGEGGKAESFELPDKSDNARARRAVIALEGNQ